MTARVVLIVGASSGIGRASALRFAERGDHLVLASRSDHPLNTTAAACRDTAASVDTVVVDASDSTEVNTFITCVMKVHARIDVVVHTATVMGYGTIENMPPQALTRVIDTAIHSTVYLAQAVLPIMRAQRSGIFIGVNSLLGSVTVPQMGAYASAKWGQRAILRTLQQETRDAPHVHICIVSPGSINTPIYYQAANYTGHAARPPWPVLAPERAATSIVSLADKPRNHVSVPVGPANPIIITGYRLLPALYDRIVGPLFTLAALTRRPIAPTEGNIHQPQARNERIHGHWPDTK